MSRDFEWPEVDTADREKASRDLSTCYLVEAAAGTGKTTLLVARILQIVETTLCRLPRVVAITFTEKAAGELKSKLKDELESRADGADEAAERCRMALQDLDAMPVGTIHAFCRDLLSQRPVEAGVDPGFSVLDEAASQSADSDSFEQWLSEELRGECPSAAPLLRLGMPVDGTGTEATLRALFDALHDHRDDLDSLHIPHLERHELLLRVTALRDSLNAASELLAACRDPQDLCAQEIGKALRWSDSLDSDSLPLLHQALRQAPSLNKARGQQKSWDSSKTLIRARAFCANFSSAVDNIEQAFVSHLAAPLIEWMKSGVRRSNAERRDRAQLDFDDLLLFARTMLCDSHVAREYFKQRFDYILVDEFQDTDPLQTEVVFFLSERTGRFAPRWEDVELDTGKLFIVGDPKQSIYRFRRADLDLYGRVRQKIARDGELLTIRANFRSDGALISEVNTLFREWMRGHGERYEPDYVAMEPYRAPSAREPRVVVLPPPLRFQDDESNSGDIAQAEAAAVAEYIHELASENQAVPFRDIAILYPTATRLIELETALRSRGIPFEATGGRNLPQRVEIQALRAVLAAVDNPHDGMSVVGALRSPFFGCSDEELLRHRLDGGDFDYLNARSSQEHLDRSFALLRGLHEERCRRLPSETLSRIFEATTGLQVFALKPHGENRVANLLKILDMARALESAGSFSFHRLVRELDHLEERRLGEEDSVLDEDSDAVRLMTFHKAKGLEFPLVILYHLSHDYGRKQPSVVVNRHRKTVELRTAGSRTGGFDTALAEELDRQKYESLRQLYVAMTRARDKLVLPLGWIPLKARGSRRWLHDVLASRYPTELVAELDAVNNGFVVLDSSRFDLTVPLQESLVLESDSTNSTAARKLREQWHTERAARLAAFDHSDQFLTPSAKMYTASKRRTDYHESSDISASQFGLFVHRILQEISFSGGQNLESVMAAASAEYAIPDDVCRIGRELVQRALRSDLLAVRAAGAETHFRELPFTVCMEGQIMEGAMDLVFREPMGWIIVDFKTDAVSPDACPARAEGYRGQAAAYAQALREITAEEVKEVILYFLRPGVQVSLTPV